MQRAIANTIGALAPGARVVLLDQLLQTFYGATGTVARLHGGRCGTVYVDVWMDDGAGAECAVFYRDQLAILAPETAGCDAAAGASDVAGCVVQPNADG